MPGRRKSDTQGPMPQARGLTLAEAAAYCGVTPATFLAWRRAGLVPMPWPGTRIYDRKALDAALDRASGIVPRSRPTPYDEWKESRDAREAQAHQAGEKAAR